MKNLRIAVIALVLWLVCIGAASAQQTASEILTSTPWIHDCALHGDDSGAAIIFSFGKKTGTQTMYMNGLVAGDMKFRYYLSDQKDAKYDKRREGKSQTGKYIVYLITDFGSDNFLSDLMKKEGVEKTKNPAYHELEECTPEKITIPFPGVVDDFVPCKDIAAEKKRLERK